MDRFYAIALIIALIVLIICLVGIGILMQYQNSGLKFPLHPNTCPDLWNLSGDGTQCVGTIGKNLTQTQNDKTPANGGGNKYPATGSIKDKTICENYKWAKAGEINWDGVSNYNGC